MTIKNKTRNSVSFAVDETHRFNVFFDTREIFLHSYVDNVEGDPGVEYRMANTFLKNIRLLNSHSTKPIIVHQHSVGGSWTEGMMMFDAITYSESPVIIITHGLAASMGSIIPQAADLRVTMPNCWWLIHEGTTEIDPSMTCKMASAWYEWEKIIGEQMLDIYVERCIKSKEFKNKTDKQVRTHIKRQLEKKEDWWLVAQDAVHYGFADAVYGDKGFTNLDEIRQRVS